MPEPPLALAFVASRYARTKIRQTQDAAPANSSHELDLDHTGTNARKAPDAYLYRAAQAA